MSDCTCGNGEAEDDRGAVLACLVHGPAGDLEDPGHPERVGLLAADGEYVLRVRSDSMARAGILKDDYVVVCPQNMAGDGDIVIALVGDEAQIRRYRYMSGKGSLWTDDEDVATRLVDDETRILGRVVGVFRQVG